nr:MAG TPA_asm: hypothetical protein [Caudoviricetes sp.]
MNPDFPAGPDAAPVPPFSHAYAVTPASAHQTLHG